MKEADPRRLPKLSPVCVATDCSRGHCKNGLLWNRSLRTDRLEACWCVREDVERSCSNLKVRVLLRACFLVFDFANLESNVRPELKTEETTPPAASASIETALSTFTHSISRASAQTTSSSSNFLPRQAFLLSMITPFQRIYASNSSLTCGSGMSRSLTFWLHVPFAGKMSCDLQFRLCVKIVPRQAFHIPCNP